MIKFLFCDKDAYITNKIIRNSNNALSRSTDANTGQAGTIDLFKLYNETFVSSGSSGIELSRALLHFDLNPLRRLVSSSQINVNDATFKCFLHLTDVYGGQTVPSNYTLTLFPLAKYFSEGRGRDVVAYRDLDSVNWISSSISGGVITTWTSGGCDYSGSVGTTNLDYFSSGTLNGISSSFMKFQVFERGDENLKIDITQLVSGTIAGSIPDYGFRLSFIKSEEQDTYTRFVKRFYSRHSNQPFRHPKVVVHYDDHFIDNQAEAYFDLTNSVGIYNAPFGAKRNFFSGSTPITGSNSLRLDIFASKSITFWTSSYSTTHSQSINHLTSSYTYFSMSFTGSQMARAGTFISGTYFASVSLSTASPGLLNYLGNASFLNFQTVWKSLDGTVTFSSGSDLKMRKMVGSDRSFEERNIITNVLNLKETYNKNEEVIFRVFVQNYDTDLISYEIPIQPTSDIYEVMHWRLLHATTREVVIPFDFDYGSTLLSSDGKGMYFAFDMNNLPENQVYEFEFLIRENGKDYYINNQNFKFKVEL